MLTIFDMPILPSLTALAFAITFAGLLAGGLVKGVIGLGLPLVSVPIMTLAIDGRLGLALVSVPIVVTNVVQAVQGGMWRETFRRFWPLLLTMMVMLPVGVSILAQLDPGTVAVAIGLVILLFCANQASPWQFTVPPAVEAPLGALAGAVGGFIGGVSGFAGPPIIMYLVALRLQRHFFVASLGVVYICAAFALYVSMASTSLLGWQEIVWSCSACVPVLVGIALGTWLRGLIREATFRRIIVVVLAVIALKLLAQGAGLL